MSSTDSHYLVKDSAYFGHARTEIETLLPRATANVLEIGCGAGATMRWLRGVREVEHASGIELFADAAGKAEAFFDTMLVGDVETKVTMLTPGSFDLILALDVLEHLIDPWKVVRLCTDLLKPGGVFIVSLPNVAHYSVVFPLLFRGRWTYQNDGLLDRTHLRFFEARSAVALMTSSGCVIEQVRPLRFPPRFIARIPDRFGGQRVRWYMQKILDRLNGLRLIDYQYLIRTRKPG